MESPEQVLERKTDVLMETLKQAVKSGGMTHAEAVERGKQELDKLNQEYLEAMEKLEIEEARRKLGV